MSRIAYIITAGGTREFIDDVRYIGNLSTGRLGACIADEALRRSHRVSYIHGAGSALPRCREKIELEEFTSASDLKTVLNRHITAAEPPTVLVHAAAVSDFIPEKVPGKLSSDLEELVLRFRRAEKIVDFIKTWNPRVLLVKFKLESNRTPDELLHLGREAGKRSKAELVVANDVRSISQEAHRALIIRCDGTFIEAQGKEQIAKRLLEETERSILSAHRKEKDEGP